jgi:hypothetical protein
MVFPENNSEYHTRRHENLKSHILRTISTEKFGHYRFVVNSLVCLPLDPKVRGFKSRTGDGFLRATKIRSTPSFGAEVKYIHHILYPDPPVILDGSAGRMA